MLCHLAEVKHFPPGGQVFITECTRKDGILVSQFLPELAAVKTVSLLNFNIKYKPEIYGKLILFYDGSSLL